MIQDLIKQFNYRNRQELIEKTKELIELQKDREADGFSPCCGWPTNEDGGCTSCGNQS